MAFIVVCHGCGEVLYEGRDMIPLYRLKAKHNGKCPKCGRKLANKPQNITLQPIEEKAENTETAERS